MLSLLRSSRLTGHRAAQRQLRGIKFLATDYKASPGFSVYSHDLEQAIADTITKLPETNAAAFQNADGTPRSPDDGELKQAAALAALAGQSRATLMDKFRLTNEQAAQQAENSAKLSELFLNGRRILDKIPVEDPATGKITWTVVRENQKEGWEGIMYYTYVPGLLIALGLYFFLDKENLSDWALEELRLRAQEKHGESSTANTNDDLIIERILSGDYDRLAGLRKAGSELPSTLL